MMIGLLLATALSLNGNWAFRFEEGQTLETASGRAFEATDSMSVPGCYDMMPKWLCKRGTGLYRRTFVLDRPVENAWLLVEGMGLRAKFAVDGREIGSSAYPWQELEIPTGPLAAGEHELFAALDNTLDPKKQMLALDYYDFYLYGGFYHGVSLVFDNRKLNVRTRDYKTGEIEVEVVNEVKVRGEGEQRTLVFDGTNKVIAVFKDNRATVRVPGFKLWSPAHPNLHQVELVCSCASLTSGEDAASPLRARFGIREVKAEKRRIWLNGEPIYLKGANRHEAHPQHGAATPESQMVEDIQLLKSMNCNFVRGCHYQQSRRFLDYCDEMGLLVWEESLGWNNKAEQMADPEYFRQQVEQTKMMVRASFNHPSVIIYAFQNENASQTKEGKAMNDALIDAIRGEDSGRLVTFACSHNKDDISNERTDLVAYNTYPGWFDNKGVGDNASLNRIVAEKVRETTDRFRKLYPEKPIIISEMGVCAVYGAHDPAAAQWTEEFQCDYVGAAIRAVFADPEMCGFTLWHFADARSYHRSGGALRGKPFAQNLAGAYDGYRRPKLLAGTVRRLFATKAEGEGAYEAESLPAIGERIPSSGYDPSKPDCGLGSAKVFEAPIPGLAKIGEVRVPHAREVPETSSASIGFEGLDRLLFDATPDVYEKLGACGVKRARVQTMWSRCEKEKGKFDFSELDAVVNGLSAQGIRPWFSVSFGNVLYMTGCYTKAAVGCVPLYYGDECRAAWCRYVRELARRYRGKVSEWEIWNECDTRNFWRPHGPDAVEYIKLVKLTGGIIREEIPEAKIGGCTASGGLRDWGRAFFENGGGQHIDFWCFHTYGPVPERYRGEQQVATEGEEPDFAREHAWIRNYLDTHGAKHVAVWQGESGFPSWFPKDHWLYPKGVCQEGWQSQANQAKWLLRRWLTDRRAGFAVSSFYQACDIVRRYSMGVISRPHPAEHGVLNGWTHEPKMSYFALGNYNALFATAKADPSVTVGVTPERDAGVRTLAFAMRGGAAMRFVYYAPFDISLSYTGKVYEPRTDATVSVPRTCAPKDPVLVDPLRGGVYAVGSTSIRGVAVVYSGLPLTDYPLVLTDRGSLDLR